MDTFFLFHVAPVICINDSIPAKPFLMTWREKVLKETPKGILVISAHWDTSVPTVNAISGVNDTMYDYYGPDEPTPQWVKAYPEVYDMKYPAPGAPDLAKNVKQLLEKSGFGEVDVDETRGLDHGTWVPLKVMYPEANIPVCQLSIQTNRDATYHYNMGKALTPLREQGILVIGSGQVTNNRDSFGPMFGPPAQWALDFDKWVKDALLEGRYEDVNNYEKKSALAKMAHPFPGHFYPLHVAMGAAGEKSKAELIHNSWTHCTISYSAYRFTNAED